MSKLLTTCILALSLPAITCHAQFAQGKRPVPQARWILDQTVTAYAKLDALHEKVVCHIGGPGPSVSRISTGLQDQTVEIRLQKPNKLWIEFTMTNRNKPPDRFLIVCDGKSLWDWNSESNTFTEAPAPATLRGIPSPFYSASLPETAQLLGEVEVLQTLRKKNKIHTPPVTNWFRDAMFMGAPLKVGSPERYAGVDTVVLTTSGGTFSQVFPIHQAAKVYIGREDHLYRGMVTETGGKDKKAGSFTYRNESTYTLVDTNPRFGPADFTFVPPAGATLKAKKPTQTGAEGNRPKKPD